MIHALDLLCYLTRNYFFFQTLFYSSHATRNYFLCLLTFYDSYGGPGSQTVVKTWSLGFDQYLASSLGVSITAVGMNYFFGKNILNFQIILVLVVAE